MSDFLKTMLAAAAAQKMAQNRAEAAAKIAAKRKADAEKPMPLGYKLFALYLIVMMIILYYKG